MEKTYIAMFVRRKVNLGVTNFLMLKILVKFSFPPATSFRVWTAYLQTVDLLLNRIIWLIL